MNPTLCLNFLHQSQGLRAQLNQGRLKKNSIPRVYMNMDCHGLHIWHILQDACIRFFPYPISAIMVTRDARIIPKSTVRAEEKCTCYTHGQLLWSFGVLQYIVQSKLQTPASHNAFIAYRYMSHKCLINYHFPLIWFHCTIPLQMSSSCWSQGCTSDGPFHIVGLSSKSQSNAIPFPSIKIYDWP